HRLPDPVPLDARVHSEDAHLAVIGCPEPDSAFDRGGLAGAVASQHAEHLAGLHGEVDSVDHRPPAIGLSQPSNLYGCHVLLLSSPPTLGIRGTARRSSGDRASRGEERLTVTRVRIVDGQPLMRHELEGLLALSADVTVVGRAGDGEESLTVMAEHDPDVMLLDLRMPGRDGIETLEELTRLGADVAVLVLTTFDDDELVLRALRAGARGYLLKDVGLEELLDAI